MMIAFLSRFIIKYLFFSFSITIIFYWYSVQSRNHMSDDLSCVFIYYANVDKKRKRKLLLIIET